MTPYFQTIGLPQAMENNALKPASVYLAILDPKEDLHAISENRQQRLPIKDTFRYVYSASRGGRYRTVKEDNKVRAYFLVKDLPDQSALGLKIHCDDIRCSSHRFGY